MPPPRITAAIPMTRAQPNSAPVGCPIWGRPGMAREKVPWPVQESKPRKIREPMPAAKRPGTSTTPSMGPLSPDASMSKKAPLRGEPSRVLMAEKLPAAATTLRLCSGRSFFRVRTHPSGQPTAYGNKGRLGTDHRAESQAGQGCQHHPGQLDPGRWAVHGETVSRRMPTPPGKVADRQAYEDAGQANRWEWPPHRLSMEPERLWQIGRVEDRFLEVGHEVEEPIRSAATATPRTATMTSNAR